MQKKLHGRVGTARRAVREQRSAADVHPNMKIDLDILAVATQLVGEFGDRAVGFCHARLVEHVAVNNLRAADFWRQAMHQAQILVRDGSSASMPLDRVGHAGSIADVEGRATA
ncbi:MAG: hypothetical protein ACK5YI_07135 [Rhodospirillales bacterium]